jgi:ATP-binding cassette subfamily B protein
VVAVGGWLMARGRLSPGELLAAIQYGAMGAGIGGLVAGVNKVARARAGSRRVAEVLDRPAPRYGRRTLPAGPGALTFRGVSARAGDAPVLTDVNLTLPGGRPIAVVGRSGSGKSTLAALAARLTDPDSGRICLDGIPLTELSADTLRREIGVAFERPVLVGATVGDAVGLGHDRPDAAAVSAVLRSARADGFVALLPRGADTALSRAPLSGGEAQRLGLARAWHARRLLVLDDATSSLDTATEAEIMRLLTGESRRTHLIVAHRAGTAAQCATVVWLEDGRVRAVAPHRALWDDPDYRAVFGSDPGRGEQP